MKLRNKKTGTVFRVEFLNNWQTDDGTEIGFRECDTNTVWSYSSLAELNEEWEDYTENDIKHYYCISMTGDVHELIYYGDYTQSAKDKMAIGNYFETEAEAKKAVEFLKALKLLKDNGIRFELNIKDYCLKIKHKRVLDDIEAKETYEALKQVAGVND